jgi:hypothetical protein
MLKKLTVLLAVLFATTLACAAQTQINPKTQIRWPDLTGTVDPAAPAFPCTTTQYGMTYVNLTTNVIWACLPAGWTENGGVGVTLGGDVTGLASANSLAKLQGNTLTCGTVGANYVPLYQSSTNSFVCQALTADEIGPAFAIASFTCSTCGTYENGFSVPSPTNFTAAYTSAPTSANISDGTNVDTLTTPFTSGNLAHAYAGAATFTLTAVGATTKTAQQSISRAPCVFGGVGAAGATATVTQTGSGQCTAGETATLSTGAALAALQLSASQAGQTFGPFNPSNQKIYLLLIGGSHTFTSGGFAFPMNTPTAVAYVNINGSTVAMYLYESANLLSVPFSVLVAS